MVWFDQGDEFYSTFYDNDIKIYSTHNEGKSVVAKRFIKTLKSKIDKHMIAVSKTFVLTC